MLAGNRPKDSEAVHPIPSPIISRVNLHELTFNHLEWLNWGSHIHPGIRSVIASNPDRLCYFTKEMVEAVQPYATPRTWDYANDILKGYTETQLARMEPKSELWSQLLHHLSGTLGYENATFRDGTQRTLLQYLQEAAQEEMHEAGPVIGKVRSWVQVIKSGTPHVDLSVLYVYWYARKLAGNEKKKMGLLCHHATAAVMAYGVCEDSAWPYRVEKWDHEPPVQAQRDSERFDAVQYARLASSDEAKASLSQGVPVLFGLDIPGAYYDDAASTGLLPNVGTYDHHPMDEHTMLVVGYDDQQKTWLAQNSWGAAWGERGFCRVPYELAAKYAWNDELWAIGAMENLDRARLVGPSVEQAVQDTQQNATRQIDEALKRLGSEIRDDLEKRTDDAKLSIRERLQAQERELEARRKKD